MVYLLIIANLVVILLFVIGVESGCHHFLVLYSDGLLMMRCYISFFNAAGDKL